MIGSEKISHLIYCPFNEPFYLDVVRSIAQDLLYKNEKVIVLQPASPKSNVEFYSSKILKTFRRIEPDILFAQDISKIGITAYRGGSKANLNYRYQPILDENIEFQLSLNSSLISFFADSGPFDKQRHIRKRKQLINLANRVYHQTLDVIEENDDISDIYIPNGRFFDQKAFFLAATQLKPDINRHFFERGFRDNAYYLGRHSLHDRIAIQNEIANSTKFLFASEATQWFNSRKLNWEVNEFIFKWETIVSEKKSTSSRKIAVLFNSSNDEFVSLGPNWNDSDWKSQWEAFSRVAEKLLNDGFDVMMRLHPNGLNKSRREKNREKNEIKSFKNLFPGIKIYEPGEQINSYFLIEQADLVVVWNSTIGLEASRMGKSVMCLNAAEWDKSISVSCVKNFQDLENFEHTRPIVDSTLPIKFLSGRMAMDVELLSDEYSKQFKEFENGNFFYRLAKYFGGAKPFDAKIFIKVFFKNQKNWLYRSLRKLNYKLKSLG